MKTCERCDKEIPEDYQNLLCDACYKIAETQVKEPVAEQKPQPDQGILDPNYKENPEKDDKEQWATNIVQFERTGFILWHPTRDMYEYIKTYCLNRVTQHPQYPKHIWKPKIVDVGCGIGLGTNIMSQEADFAWGIDKNENSAKFAVQAFSRYKNGIYYSAQVSFDQVDIMTDTREFMKFDVVVAIEIIEHVKDARAFIETLVRKFDKRNKNDPTVYFFSTPNRNNKIIDKTHPRNNYHVREWTSGEFHKLLLQYFNKVELMNTRGEPIPLDEYETTVHTPILAKCEGAK